MVHGVDGTVATLCLDLDTSKALQTVVDADADAIGALLSSCGLRFVADHSPSGGRHLYVPLSERLAAEDARELVEALGTRFHSLDALPHQNVTDGCIRPPGSWHKSMTGHQELDTPLAEAYDVLRRRNPAPAVAALRRALAASIHQVRAKKALKSVSTVVATDSSTPAGPLRVGSAKGGSVLRQVARTGIYDTARYKSASHIRMAVLAHLANFSLSLAVVQGRLGTDLAGLAALYGDAATLGRLLPFEWDKAQAWVAQKPGPSTGGKEHSNKCDTSLPLTHGGGTGEVRSAGSVQAEINDLENVLYAILDQRLARTGREGITLRFLMRAVIGFARAKGSLVVDVSCRSFAAAMGQHHSTIARLLPRLVNRSGGMLSKIEDAQGWRADSYLLGLPEQWRDVAKANAWRKGKIHGIRPVFRALGAPAALVYEAIERGHHSPTTAVIMQETGLSRPTVAKELNVLAELSMVERHHGAWQILHTTSLTRIAEWLGVLEDYEQQTAVIRAQRRQWHAYLERFQEPPICEEDIYDVEQAEWDPWIPVDHWDLSALERHLLDA
ncbi:hypothetical protein [Arthrobacter sp. ERGS1:01]|uniref:hypothetical protein n=1 Tax=Arthrobacter sp. ERGS1:01 TaxID=1704044 RepID=UPI0006B541D7|nr:hypothetical protein [Arthrobacter sp. ERGS1:01]